MSCADGALENAFTGLSDCGCYKHTHKRGLLAQTGFVRSDNLSLSLFLLSSSSQCRNQRVLRITDIGCLQGLFAPQLMLYETTTVARKQEQKRQRVWRCPTGWYTFLHHSLMLYFAVWQLRASSVFSLQGGLASTDVVFICLLWRNSFSVLKYYSLERRYWFTLTEKSCLSLAGFRLNRVGVRKREKTFETFLASDWINHLIIPRKQMNHISGAKPLKSSWNQAREHLNCKDELLVTFVALLLL